MFNAGKMALLVPKGIQRYPDSGDTVKVQSYHITTMKNKTKTITTKATTKKTAWGSDHAIFEIWQHCEGTIHQGDDPLTLGLEIGNNWAKSRF